MSSTKTIATYDEIADQLTTDYWRAAGSALGPRSFDVAPGGTLKVDITGLAPAGQQLARWALEAWTGATGIEFRFVTKGARITFSDDKPGATGGPTIVLPNGQIVFD